MSTPLDLSSLPLYLDGGDGSLWGSLVSWEEIFSDAQLASRKLVRVSDLLVLLESNGIKVCCATADKLL